MTNSDYVWTTYPILEGASSWTHIVKVYTIYGEQISQFTVTTQPMSTNRDNIKYVVSNITSFPMDYYSYNPTGNFIERPEKADDSLYQLVYTGDSAIFDENYYKDKIYDNRSLGNFLSSEKTYEYGTNGTLGDEYIYYYEFGVVSVYDIARIREFIIEDIEIDYIPISGYQVYLLKDNRIETDCCLDVECYPNLYKMIGD